MGRDPNVDRTPDSNKYILFGSYNSKCGPRGLLAIVAASCSFRAIPAFISPVTYMKTKMKAMTSMQSAYNSLRFAFNFSSSNV